MLGKSSNPELIRLRGVRQNNLKNFNLDLPTGRLIVITGPSGSGKSSLAFDTLFAEGQRRYIETFSPYARQFFDRMDKPAVDRIENIPPAIAIEQRNSVKTTRSTIGTMTEIADYMKHVWPHLATLHCRQCAKPVTRDYPASVWEAVRSTSAVAPGPVTPEPAGPSSRPPEVIITFRLPLSSKMTLDQEFELLAKQGYQRIVLENSPIRLDDALGQLQAAPPDSLTVLQDRVSLSETNRARFVEACEQAFHFGKGKLAVQSAPPTKPSDPHSLAPFRVQFSRDLHCADCNLDYKEPTPGLFHFNHPSGACPACKGFGRVITIDYKLAVPDTSKTLAEGLVRPWLNGHGLESQNDLLKFCKKRKVPTDTPFRDLPLETQRWVLDGDPGYGSSPEMEWPAAWYGVKGYFRWLESKSYKMHVRVLLARYRAYTLCPSCQGARFQPESLLYRWSQPGFPSISLAEFYQLPVDRALQRLEQSLERSTTPLHHSKSPDTANNTFRLVLAEVTARLRYLVEVGLGYLTLDRPSRTLSGGETERVSLTTCLGASLVNTLFVLDEPSVGLHHRDTRRLVGILRRLRDMGNTVVVVEHDPEIIRAADHIVDIGPASGEQGGYCVFNGPADQLQYALETSPTARCLYDPKGAGSLVAREAFAPLPTPRRSPVGPHKLVLTGASCHNLNQLSLQIPLERLVCITGVSGSGKTTLVRDILYPVLAARLSADQPPENEEESSADSDSTAPDSESESPQGLAQGASLTDLQGAKHLRHVLLVDQSGLGKTPRSNPVLYIGAFVFIRELFASSELARRSDLPDSAFSFNSRAGQCERCRGAGFEQIEMQFLSDVFIRCPDCNGRRYRQHILDIRIKPPESELNPAPAIGHPELGASIADLLEATVDDAIQWLKPLRTGKRGCRANSAIASLELLSKVGLGYLHLGQPINTLSGGECQRLKLVSHMAEFAKRSEPEPTLFIFDEPTTGLHLRDVELLLKTFQGLVDAGHSLLIIEHNLEVIRAADWVIDMGPEGGSAGGQVVAEGTPDSIALHPTSHTAIALRAASAPAAALLLNDRPTPAFSPTPPPTASRTAITIRGAREHNLKDLSVDIPRNQFVVLTGVSGSGKSTLAFDLIFAEGQRRFLDSMSAYARQFVDQLARPDVDQILGIPPTVSIEQRLSRGGGKSTVATVTEIHHFLRLLYARLGTQYCPDCNQPVTEQTRDTLLRALADEGRQRGDLLLLAPVIRGRKGFHTEVATWAAKQGFAEIRADGKIHPTNTQLRLDRFKEHDVEIVVGVLDRPRGATSKTSPDDRRLIETALRIGQGVIMTLDNHGKIGLHSTHRACHSCGKSYGELDPKSFSYNSSQGWCPKCRGFGELFYLPDVDRGARADAIEESWFGWQEGKREPCPECHGARINLIARSVHLDALIPTETAPRSGKRPKPGPPIHELGNLPVTEALELFNKVLLEGRAAIIARDILPEIRERLRFLAEVGLGYLNLNRAVPTLSGGESQRIRLAAQLGSNLSGVLYVLDEPTIGLHPRDNEQLLDTLQRLQGRGNSLVVVEHDDQTMRRADHIIDLGPGAGVHGGNIVAQGTLEELRHNRLSVTGACLRQPHIEAELRRHRPGFATAKRGRPSKPAPNLGADPAQPPSLQLTGASVNNLRNVTLKVPLGRFVAVTGVSGSGKSTLIRHCLIPALTSALAGEKFSKKGPQLSGWEAIQALHEVDQSPIGRTPRSTPATYVGFFDTIRELFAQTPEARLRGYSGSRFSFNSSQGRCPQCEGAGNIKLEMNFLPPAFVKCDACNGLRFNKETLDITYGGKTIAEVLDLSVEEALTFFQAMPKLRRALSALNETGLGYVRLGQTSPTLSGGEAQRIKLVSHLLSGWAEKPGRALIDKRSFFVLEEPTIGLHMADVRRLVGVIQKLVDAGHTVLVIEHNIDLISAADWVIDLGPEAGEGGGRIIAQGPPELIARTPNSHTGRYLQASLPELTTG